MPNNQDTQTMNADSDDSSRSSSDDSVAYVEYYGSTYCGIRLNSVGTAIITAATESGFTATCEVMVLERPLIDYLELSPDAMSGYEGWAKDTFDGRCMFELISFVFVR